MCIPQSTRGCQRANCKRQFSPSTEMDLRWAGLYARAFHHSVILLTLRSFIFVQLKRFKIFLSVYLTNRLFGSVLFTFLVHGEFSNFLLLLASDLSELCLENIFFNDFKPFKSIDACFVA